MSDRLPDFLPALRALNKRFIHNFVTRDVPSHDAILHPRFRCIQPDGSLVQRDAYLRYWASGFDPERIPYFDMRGENIEVIGSTALVGAVTKRASGQDGAGNVGMTRYTDSYQLKDGRWLCILAQLTTVSPAHFPADSTIVVKYLGGRLQA